MKEVFSGNFTQQQPIPEEAIAAAVCVMRHGRLHRYNTAKDELAETALLEQEFAGFVGSAYCLAVASGGYAMATALRAIGVKPGDLVLSNAFTLAPVPGSIASVGAVPVLVDVAPDLTIDLIDLERKITTSNAKVLLLSHMRGHICDMDKLMEICGRHEVQVVEDCAHTMGASWRGTNSGRHGVVGCYSTQTYKHMNSGEGGFLVTDDPQVMARATILSGSYMLFELHLAGPSADAYNDIKYETPNISGRMDNLRAAILRPQLRDLSSQVAAWNERYRALESGLRGVTGLTLIERSENENFVGSSFQFLLDEWNADAVQSVVNGCKDRGVELKWFGAAEPVAFTSKYDSWRYAKPTALPNTDRIMAGLIDLRVPLTFSITDCDCIARIIRSEVENQFQQGVR